MEGKSSTLTDKVRQNDEKNDDSEHEIYQYWWPKHCKFAVERDWNCDISENVRNLSFLENWMSFFSEKELDFFSKIVRGGKFAWKSASNDIIS